MGDINRREHHTITREYRYAKPPPNSVALWKRTRATFGPFFPLLVAVILGIATTAGAISASKQIRSTTYGFQAPGQMEYLGAPGLQEILW